MARAGPHASKSAATEKMRKAMKDDEFKIIPGEIE
jgi:hypothetical protein